MDGIFEGSAQVRERKRIRNRPEVEKQVCEAASHSWMRPTTICMRCPLPCAFDQVKLLWACADIRFQRMEMRVAASFLGEMRVTASDRQLPMRIDEDRHPP